MPVLSSKPYKAGDVVFRCKPLVFVVNNEFKGKHCDNCLKQSDQLKKCSKCLEMYYCGKDCQINDWKYHKNECKIFKHKTFQRSLFTEKDLLLLRLYLRVKSDPTFAIQRHKLVDGSDVCLKDINISYDSMPYKAMLTKVCQQFKSIGIDLNAKDLRHWFALVYQNNADLFHYSEDHKGFTQTIAITLVLGSKSVNHSCIPNAVYMSNGLSMEIRAMKSISTGDEITISYIPLFMNRTDRRLALKAKGIDCNCSKCGLHLDKYIDYQEIRILLDGNCNSLNIIWIKLYKRLLNVSKEMDTNFLLHLRTVLGDFHPVITLYLLKSFKCLSINSRSANKSVLKYWYKEVERSLLITHGSDNPLYAILRKYNPLYYSGFPRIIRYNCL